jgi:23S rRNA (uridine2552-2'-O)-methyltransferase
LARTKSSRRWLERHVADPYVRKAQALGFRSRAAFKLQEIDRKERLLRPGMRVVDLGAAPGGWAQVAAERVGPKGAVIAVDLLGIEAIPGVQVLEGDFLDPDIQRRLETALGADKADLVLSDMSPNISGIASADQARAETLVRAALDFCRARLKPGGAFLVKVFQGEAFDGIVRDMRRSFRDVKIAKPSASRAESREMYLIARGLKPA